MTEWRHKVTCPTCKNLIGYSATDEALAHPNNEKWQIQWASQWKRKIGELSKDIADLSTEDLADQSQLIEDMTQALNEVKALKGVVW